MIHTIDGVLLREMFLDGAANLEKNRAYVDSLNVFPVPDGDTGTNMSQTLNAAAKEIRGMTSNRACDIAAAVARGSLRGARGNSGVILSQILRGFAKAAEGKSELTGRDLAKALRCGVEMSYKAVLKPKEGTILTVARAVADEAERICGRTEDMEEMMEAVIRAGEAMLRKTPDMLPVLKQAGVVDSGGKGLMIIYQGFLLAMTGEVIAPAEETEIAEPMETRDEVAAYRSVADIEFGYCTEFFIQNMYDFVTLADIDKLRGRFERMGDSLILVGDTELVKVHIHTNMPGKVLTYALALGELVGLKIENMRQQCRELLEAQADVVTKPVGVVAVASGDGLAEIFKGMQADAVVSGGQTANPSIEDIAKAVDSVPAETVFVLPNNKNIVLAAQQAAGLTKRKLVVIPTRTIPQGISALMGFSGEASAEENQEAMTETYKQVKSGTVTNAVRDTNIGGKEIREGDIMGIQEDDIKIVGSSVAQVTYDLIMGMVDEDSGLITLLYGEGADEDAANELAARLEAETGCELVVQAGGQPLYPYIVSVE